MNQKGLGYNSPIQLRLSRDNYEAMLSRHGQYVRLLYGHRCPCVTTNNRPDPHCDRCHGDGWLYRHPESTLEIVDARITGDATAKVSDRYRIRSVRSLRDSSGVDVPVLSYSGREITFDPPRRIPHYEVLEAFIENALRHEASGVPAIYLGNGTVQCSNLAHELPWGQVPYDIAEVSRLYNETTGEEYTVESTYTNHIVFSGTTMPQPDEAVLADLSYAKPVLFGVLNQATNKADQRFLEDVQGDASMIFPASYRVSEGDIVTLMAAEHQRKQIITKTDGEYDRLPDYFVREVYAIETDALTYTPGVDFALWDRNTIHWITTPPEAGTTLSLFYSVHPTYRVLREFPGSRSSENQNFPRRVAIKLVTGRTGRVEV